MSSPLTERNLGVLADLRTMSQREVARKYGISPGRVYQIAAAHRYGPKFKAHRKEPVLGLLDDLETRLRAIKGEVDSSLRDIAHIRAILSDPSAPYPTE